MPACSDVYLIGEWVPQHVLVEGACEEGIDELAIIQSLAEDAPHKLEEVQVVGPPGLVILHHRVGVGLEGRAVLWHLDKQAEVGVEDLPRHHLHTEKETFF